MNKRVHILACCFGVLISAGTALHYNVASRYLTVYAQSGDVSSLQKEINDRSSRLRQIEEEIAQYQSDLKKVGAEKNTLQKAINQLELERKKINADLSYTQTKIGSTDLEISKLSIEIGDAEESITTNREAMGVVLRKLHEADQSALFLLLLQTGKLSEFWGSVEELRDVQNAIRAHVERLASLKALLESKRDAEQNRRADLVSLKNQYSDQQEVLSNNKQEKDQLLKQTRSKETEYQKLLKDRQTARETIVKELRDFESKLQFILDPNSVPSPGTAVFSWPVKNVIITQRFGGTEFARRNAGAYGGRPYHPGVDFGVPRGTQIFAPLSGRVRATGNTDLVSGCYSWGKWILVDHANGLSTLYAHLDVISVSAGQEVKTGEVIGYSGNTGYSTGPHLHFTVYAKSGVTVRQFNEIKTVTSCGPASTPVAATDAYLDPLLYLPTP